MTAATDIWEQFAVIGDTTGYYDADTDVTCDTNDADIAINGFDTMPTLLSLPTLEVDTMLT